MLLPDDIQRAVIAYNDQLTGERLTLAMANPPKDPAALAELKREIRAFNAPQSRMIQPISTPEQGDLFGGN